MNKCYVEVKVTLNGYKIYGRISQLMNIKYHQTFFGLEIEKYQINIFSQHMTIYECFILKQNLLLFSLTFFFYTVLQQNFKFRNFNISVYLESFFFKPGCFTLSKLRTVFSIRFSGHSLSEFYKQ